MSRAVKKSAPKWVRPLKPAPIAAVNRSGKRSGEGALATRLIDALLVVLAEGAPSEAAAARCLQAVRCRGVSDGRIWLCRQNVDMLSPREREFVANCASRLNAGRELTERQAAWLGRLAARFGHEAAQ